MHRRCMCTCTCNGVEKKKNEMVWRFASSHTATPFHSSAMHSTWCCARALAPSVHVQVQRCGEAVGVRFCIFFPPHVSLPWPPHRFTFFLFFYRFFCSTVLCSFFHVHSAPPVPYGKPIAKGSETSEKISLAAGALRFLQTT